MAAPSTVAPTGYRLVVLLLLTIVLGVVYTGYLHMVNADLTRRNQYVTNNYRTVRDSVRRVGPAVRLLRVPGPVQLVRVPVPPTAAQLAGLRAALTVDVVQQVRRELARQPVRTTSVTLAQRPLVLPLRDTTVVRREAGTNHLALTTLKTAAYADHWLTLSGTVIPGRAGRPDSLAVRYRIRSEYDVKAWRKRVKGRHWWQVFGHRRIYVTLHNRNPNATDTGLDSVPVPRK